MLCLPSGAGKLILGWLDSAYTRISNCDLVRKVAPVAILIVISVLFHREWFFSTDPITSGDWGFHYIETMKEMFTVPYAWTSQTGLGSYQISLSFHAFHFLYGLFANFGIPFAIAERVLFFWPIAILSCLGMYYLSYKLFKSQLLSFVASLLYGFNTYILLIQTDHMGIAMVYSITPLIIGFFTDVLENASLRRGILVGVLLAISLIYDPRITYIISFVMLTVFILFLISRKISLRKIAIGSLSIVLALSLNSFWVVGYFLAGTNALNARLDVNPTGSFMDIINSLALYHPFWTNAAPIDFSHQPVPFYMLFIPSLAFASLMFRVRKKNLDPTSFPYDSHSNGFLLVSGIIAVVGVFLVKQENPPFGEVYTWLFHNFPAFNLFREASKFYLLIALAYSILLGYFVMTISNKLVSRQKLRYLRIPFIFAVMVLLLIQAKPAFTNELGKNFVTTNVPAEYIQLKDQLAGDNDYFRTMWYPVPQRFAFHPNVHPMLSSAETIFDDPLRQFLPQNPRWTDLPDDRTFANILSVMSVKYIVIPYDSNNDLYKYYLPQNEFVAAIEKYEWLDRTNMSDRIYVYSTPNHMNHFFGIYDEDEESLRDLQSLKTFDEMNTINFESEMINPTKYSLRIETDRPLVLAFSESYDSNWIAYVNGNAIRADPLFSLINGFTISEAGKYEITVEYQPQIYVYVGTTISVITASALVVFFLASYRYRLFHAISRLAKAIHVM